MKLDGPKQVVSGSRTSAVMTNAISVDVEDYFHPSELQHCASLKSWESLPSRVERSTAETLDLFARYNVSGTFFILGWVAHRFPALVRRIAAAKHEIACHSYFHRLVYELNPDEFRVDTRQAQAAISDACGIMPRMYRAPSYSITLRCWWALDILAECGFTHDSSIFPILHDRYGVPGFSRYPKLLETASGSILEVPVATVKLSKYCISPVGGGAYLRLLPYRYTAAGIRRINQQERRPACMYFHPWELDPEQPRIAKGLVSQLRTYIGLRSMKSKIERLLRDFRFATLGEVYPLNQETTVQPAQIL
jgi:polysaccharide deacetylase family protein (PEP-CTERM system associated)